MKNNIYLKCCVCFVLLYIVQFLICPGLMPNYYPSSNNATGIFLISAIIVIAISIIFITDKLLCLFMADCFYGCLICLFNSRGMYGIGRIGMNLDGLQTRMSFKMTLITSLVIVVNFYVVQVIFVLIKKLIQKIAAKNKLNNSK